jgi:hypothetical protein
MSTMIFLALAGFTVLCMVAAQRLAYANGKSPVGWMLAAALLGPLPLIPLALFRDRTGPMPEEPQGQAPRAIFSASSARTDFRPGP